ncbi:MAG: hypothetical protein ACJ790_20445 [Myxococcaceae bacterium]
MGACLAVLAAYQDVRREEVNAGRAGIRLGFGHLSALTLARRVDVSRTDRIRAWRGFGLSRAVMGERGEFPSTRAPIFSPWA